MVQYVRILIQSFQRIIKIQNVMNTFDQMSKTAIEVSKLTN